MEKTTTQRGFDITNFKDLYDNDCSLQESSLATQAAIWLGISRPTPKIMASQAKQFGVETDETTGWVEYPIPEEVLISTRMHLSVDLAKELITELETFVKENE